MLERGEEHQQDVLGLNTKRHMRDHMLTDHPKMLGTVLESFRLTMIKACPSALSRQVQEAIEIDRGGGDNRFCLGY